MCRFCISRWAGKVKNRTPKIAKKDGKKKRTGRAKKRAQFNKIEQCNQPGVACNSMAMSSKLHVKNPRFSCQSPDVPMSYKQWLKIMASPVNENIAKKHIRIEKYTRTYLNAAGYDYRVRSHSQKTKGSTGKSIQKDRNQASRIKVASVLYGEDYELEFKTPQCQSG